MSYYSVIVIPCYNEYARLPVDGFIDYLKLHPQSACCFVNDGSTDRTGELLNQMKAECSNAFVLGLDKNVGKAAAVQLGIQYVLKNVEAHFIGYMDADLATPLSFISVMEQEMKLDENVVMVFGSRQMAEKDSVERKAFRHYSGRLVSGLITWVLGYKYGDTQCGAKLFSKEGATIGFERPFISSWVFDVEIIKRLILHYKNDVKNKIKEIPVNQWKDVGNSKVSKSYVFKMIGELLKIRGMK